MFLTETFTQPDIAPDALGAALTKRLLTLGRGLTQNGKPLTTQETLLPYANELAQKFLQHTLPKWKELGVCS